MVYTGDSYTCASGRLDIVKVDREGDVISCLVENVNAMPYAKNEDGTVSFTYSWFERKVIEGVIKLIEP